MAALAALLVIGAGCAPRYARVVSGDPHQLSQLSVVVRPAARFKSASPEALATGGCIGGGIGWGIGFLLTLNMAGMPGNPGYWVSYLGASAGAAAGAAIAEGLRMWEKWRETPPI